MNAMDIDLLALYGQASDWAATKVEGAAADLQAPTTCDGWDVRTLLNHMLQTQSYFVGAARGEDVAPPGGTPPDVISDEPRLDFDRARAETMETFGEPGVIERTGPALGIAFADQLLHGWDLASSTGQDSVMPSGLPDAAYSLIHGAFTDEQRKGIFKPEIAVASDASPQDRLLAYTGRDPSALR